jgi:NhaP-type Na+/H+ and K+/H+ antiporter
VSAADQDFYGDLVISPTAPLGALAESYGLSIDSADREATVAGFMLGQFNGRIEVGDRLVLGPIDLIARAVDDAGAVTEIGLSLARVDDTPRPKPGPLGRLSAWLQRLFVGRPTRAAILDAINNRNKRADGG